MLSVGLYLMFIAALVTILSLAEERRQNQVIARYDHLNLKTNRVIRMRDAEHVPELMVRVLKASGVVDNHYINQMTLCTTGWSRRMGGRRRIRFSCVDYCFYNITAFMEIISYRMLPLIRIRTLNNFRGTHLERRVLAMASIATERSVGRFEENHNGVVRYFRQMIFSPSRLLDPMITWSQIGEQVLVGVLDIQGYRIKAYFAVEPSGLISNMAITKYRAGPKGFQETLWRCEFSDYQPHDGFQVPMRCRSFWHTDNGVEEDIAVQVRRVVFQ